MQVKLKIAIVQWVLEDAGRRSQRRLAARIGWHDTKLSTILHGWRKPTLRERQTIAAALGKRVDELFDEPEAA